MSSMGDGTGRCRSAESTRVDHGLLPCAASTICACSGGMMM